MQLNVQFLLQMYVIPFLRVSTCIKSVRHFQPLISDSCIMMQITDLLRIVAIIRQQNICQSHDIYNILFLLQDYTALAHASVTYKSALKSMVQSTRQIARRKKYTNFKFYKKAQAKCVCLTVVAIRLPLGLRL